MVSLQDAGIYLMASGVFAALRPPAAVYQPSGLKGSKRCGVRKPEAFGQIKIWRGLRERNLGNGRFRARTWWNGEANRRLFGIWLMDLGERR